jgi:ribosomal protein S18 acetylase RimI-like enzyme
MDNPDKIEQFELKDGRVVQLKRLTKEDYENEASYIFVHNWLHQVNKYLALEFEENNLERNKKGFMQMLSNLESLFVVGAIFEEKIIAQSSLELNTMSKKHRHIGTWGIAIHPDFQNQGLGTKLLNELEKIAKEKGIKKLETSYYEGNDAAKRLYVEKLGYEIEGRQKFGARLKDGSYTDKVLIGKIIDESIFSNK